MGRYRVWVILLVVVISISKSVLAGGADYLEKYDLMSTNDYLELYLNRETTEVAIRDKTSEQVWFTNPPQRDRLETVANDFNKEVLASQLRISFFDTGDKFTQWDNKHQSIDYNQFSIQEISNGIRIDYTFGEEWKQEDYIPTMASKSFFENEILAKLDDHDREFVLDKFWLCAMVKNERELEEYTFTDVSTRVDEKYLFGEYVIKMRLADGTEIDLTAHGSEKDFPAFRKEGVLKYLLGKLVEGKEYTFISELKKEDLMVLEEPFYLQVDSMFEWDKKKLASLFKSIGLSPEMIVKEHEKYNIKAPYKNIMIFRIPLEYRLDGRDLLVSVPLPEVDYPANVVDYSTGGMVTLPLVDIEILPFWGAGSKEDEGYIFVPDGSGALINFNNGKDYLPEYSKSVYGEDKALAEVKKNSNISAPMRLPVYGIKKNEQGFLAIIESGDSITTIRAKVANNINSYNAVYPSFRIIPYTSVQLVGVLEKGKSVNVYQSRKTDTDLLIRYKLLNGEEANYSGMANVYRSYLQEKFNWKKLAGESDYPFLLEIVGSYDKIMSQWGVPRRTVIPLTTFEEARELVLTLKSSGIENIDILYSGWLQGGIRHIYPRKVAIEEKLGGQKGFEELSQYLFENNLEFYPEVNFLHVEYDRVLDGFNALLHSARFLEGGQVRCYDYDWATYYYKSDKVSSLLSPKYLETLVEDFINGYVKLTPQLQGISLRYLGQEYYSDFRRTPQELIDREEAIAIIGEQMTGINNQVQSIMVRGGNLPALERSQYVVEAPMYGGANKLIDRGIPFYQMVLHGYVKYSGEPVNLNASRTDEFLKIIETGAVPYYRGSYRPSDMLKQSDFDDNYCLYYQDWLENAVEFYCKINAVMKELQDKTIIKHSQIGKSVYRTDYENGFSVVVNYGEEPIKVGGELVEGRGYRLLKGEN